MPNLRRYPRNQSPLYKVKSPAQLANVLCVQRGILERLERSGSNYNCWQDKKTGRDIQVPKPLLKHIHRRAANLLARIETPGFLHSAVKGRSYISNASEHNALQRSVKVDIKKFYRSTRGQAVYHFFKDRMLCAGDVAGILAHLLTVSNHLSTGSNASPILSYFAYEDMFLEIEKRAQQRGCIMTCYVDDMVFTGSGATSELIYQVRRVVGRYHLQIHKTKMFQSKQPRIITGVAVTKAGMKLPNHRQKTIREELKSLHSGMNEEKKAKIKRRLMCRLYEASQIDSAWRPRADQMATELREMTRRSQ